MYISETMLGDSASYKNTLRTYPEIEQTVEETLNPAQFMSETLDFLPVGCSWL